MLSPLFPYEELTAEQQTTMAAFAARIPDPSVLAPKWRTMFETQRYVFLVKFLVARKWVVDDALKMALDSSKFRNERKLDVSPHFPSAVPVFGWSQAELEAFQGLGPRPEGDLDKYAKQLAHTYVAAWHKWDKEGRPVYIERTGKINVTELVNRCRAMVPPGGDISVPCTVNHLHSNEVGGMLMCIQDAKLKPQVPISQVSAVMDCDGFSLSQIFGPAMELLKAQTAMDQANYPEGLHRVYVANAPTTLTVAWSIVKGWLEPRVQKKVVFMKPHETKAKLLEVIAAENLPDWLGGTSTEWPGSTDVSHDPSVEDCGLIPTEVVKVKKGCRETLRYKVLGNTEVLWEFFVATEYDITLEAAFVGDSKRSTNPAYPGAEPLPAAVRAQKGSHAFTPLEDGTVVFTFDNYHAWVHTKKVSFRVVGGTKM